MRAFSLSHTTQAWLLAAAGILALRFTAPIENVLSWDVLGYYFYLPALFIYQDLGIKDIGLYQQIIEQYQNSSTLYQVITLPDGTHLFRYSLGMAVLYLPFFLIGHWVALSGPWLADGFSEPYQYAVAMGGLLYAVIGIALTGKVLRKFFSDKIVALSLLLLVFGTNYLEMAGRNGLMSHNFLFTLYAAVLWLTWHWHRKPGFWNSIFLGGVMGVMTMSRPTEVVVIFIPLLWNVTSRESFRQKLAFLRQHRKAFLTTLLAFMLAGSPQLLYWKLHTGSWLFYSYGNPGEGLEVWWPYTLKVLFSFRKGWLIYTPLMAMGILGLVGLLRKGRPYGWSLMVYFLLNLWLVSSWTCWYYAGSFSQRALVQSYPVMAFGLAYALEWVLSRQLKIKIAVMLGITLLLFLNLFQTWQYTRRIIDSSRMTWDYYKSIFLKTSVSEGQRDLLLVRRSAETYEYMPEDLSAFRYRLLGEEGFEHPVEGRAAQYVDAPVRSGRYALRLSPEHRFSQPLEWRYKDITNQYYAWIRTSVWVYPVPDSSRGPYHLVVTFAHKGENYKYRTYGPSLDFVEVVPGQWNKLEMDYMTPEVRTRRDKLYVYLWLQGEGVVYFDDLRVEAFEPK